MNDEHWAQAHAQADWLPYKPTTFMRSGALITDSPIDRPTNSLTSGALTNSPIDKQIPCDRELLSELIDPPDQPTKSLRLEALIRAH